jgi:outer membrane protein assembly factor BamB
MPAKKIANLKDALGIGLGIVTRVWEFKTKDWVTSVFAADIDNDGEAEVVGCSRDGRVHLLDKGGDCKWESVVGTKAWVGTGVVKGFSPEKVYSDARIVVGTRDGKVFALDKEGRTLPRHGDPLPNDDNGIAIDRKAQEEAYWYKTDYVIRQVYINPEESSTIIIGSEDRCAYGIDLKTGEQLWKFPTKGWVRAVFSYDINKDGIAEILVGSADNYLYILDPKGQLIAKYDMQFPVHTISAADLDLDEHAEILVGTDGKDLVALNYDAEHGFTVKWRKPFHNRLLSLCVTDIDQDGHSEIIAGSEDKYFYILDAKGNIIWLHNHRCRIYSINPYDIDKDGVPELLIGSDNDVVRAMRIRLRKGLLARIRRYYQLLGEPIPVTIPDLTTNERDLLQDLLNKDNKEYVTLRQAEELKNAGKYLEALAILLKLEQQKVQQPWHKATIGHIRSVCYRKIAGVLNREIIVGTTEGNVLAFNAQGIRQWSSHLNDRIIDVQTGFLDHHRQEEIVICSSDHHLYIVSGERKRKRREKLIDSRMSSIRVVAPQNPGPAEIVIGSEDKKLYIFGSDLQAPIEKIDTKEGIRVVHAYPPNDEQSAEIIAASLDNKVNAYRRNGDLVWSYETRDHIRAICLKDINGDGHIEVLIGSEDRNVHVLDHTGRLLWRYYLPHSVLSIDAVDTDNYGKVAVFVGCADSYLYVFDRNGEYQWKFRAHDRIHAVCVEDIDGDGNVEIALGSEDEFELLRLVNPKQILSLIEECWAEFIKDRSPRQVINELLTRPQSEPLLQPFVLNRLAALNSFSSNDFQIVEKFVREGSIEARAALVHIAATSYEIPSFRARLILNQLSVDSDEVVKNTVVEHIPAVMQYDWDLGYQLLWHFSENDDRYIRRLVMRKLYQVIDTPEEITAERQRGIFNLLLTAVQDKDSEWVRQEAARSLAHFLDRYPGQLIIYTHLLIVTKVQIKIFDHIAHAAETPVVKRYLRAVIDMLAGVNNDSALERVRQVVKALEQATGLNFSHDTRLLYNEIRLLLTLHSIEDIAQYQCSLGVSQFAHDNEFARILLAIFKELSTIGRELRLYLRREGIRDRLASLLDALTAIDETNAFLEQQYAKPLMGIPITNLPDHHVFILLLQRWQKLVLDQLKELRGKAELKAELQAKQTRYEDQVGIWLTVSNAGSSSANDVRIRLLEDINYEVHGNSTFEVETILSKEETTAEFILKPKRSRLLLHFEITYGDSENDMKVVSFEDHLELSESIHEFRKIPNPYLTGTPVHDNKMFYGREADMAYLKESLTHEAKSVIVLFGQRRSGKTTMLFQLINTSAFGEHVPVLIDMQGLSYNINIHNFLQKVAHLIALAMKKRALIVCEPEQAKFDSNPILAFDAFLDNVEELLERRKLILLVDEFEVLEDQVVKGKLESEIFEYLRNILQHRPYINFLFSGTHQITEHTKWYRSVFFNIADHYRLTKISKAGAEALIQEPVAGYLEYEPLTVKKIRNLSDDQPYLIHLLCRAIVNYCNNRRKTYVTINDVNVVLRKAMQTGQFHFDWIWDQVKPEGHVALSALAEGGKEDGRWLTLFEIEEVYQRHQIPFKREHLLDALKTLVDADVVESVSDDFRDITLATSKFRIPVGLTRRWLLRERPLALVREEMHD